MYNKMDVVKQYGVITLFKLGDEFVFNNRTYIPVFYGSDDRGWKDLFCDIEVIEIDVFSVKDKVYRFKGEVYLGTDYLLETIVEEVNVTLNINTS